MGRFTRVRGGRGCRHSSGRRWSFCYRFFGVRGLDHLFLFAEGTYKATTEQNLDVAADHLAQAIGILGLQAVLAVLFRNRPRAARAQIEGEPRAGATLQIEPPPPETPGLRYRPRTTYDFMLPPGEGVTSCGGDMSLATSGDATSQALVRFHERVHQFIIPKLYILRNYRVLDRVGSYAGSSLRRYLEEAFAETIAQVGVEGFRNFFVGISFPVRNGYVYVIRAGSDARFQGWSGRGILPEGAGLLAVGAALGFALELYLKPGQPAGIGIALPVDTVPAR